MAQTKEGAVKIAAKKIGIPVGKYKTNIRNGLLWCTGCRLWHKKREFNRDKSRWSKHAQSCRNYLNEKSRNRYTPVLPENRKKYGPTPGPERSGDKAQARHRVNVLVRTGKIPHPNNLVCSECGHVHKANEKRHEYDHHKGYATGKHTIVIPLCSTCHHRRHPRNGKNKD